MDNNKITAPTAGPAISLPLVLLVLLVIEAFVLLASHLSGMKIDATMLAQSLLRLVLIAATAYYVKRFTSAAPPVEATTPAAVADEPSESEADPEPARPALSTIDPLTGVPNQRGLTISILELMALADRYGHKLCVGLIRLHGIEPLPTGQHDEALLRLVNVLNESLRLPDRVGRYDGDDLMLLLPEADIQGARVIADRIQQNVATEGLLDAGGGLRLTIGIVEFQRGEDLHGVLNRLQDAASHALESDSGTCILQVNGEAL
jgi:diguanylate cyclase (GGDEF)-like protein